MYTKAELIQQEKAGKLEPIAVYTTSNSSGYAICYMDDDYVFGYHGYSETKDYFKVKINYNSSGGYINIQGRHMSLSNFMRVGR